MAETANFTQAETKTITVTVKTHHPATSPETPVAVENTVKKVSDVSLPDNWEWDSEDAKKTLPAGKDLEVIANYTGTDKEFFYNTSVKVTLQRAGCTYSCILYTGDGENVPTCTKGGKGHRERTVCGDILESNIILPVEKHKLIKIPKTEPGCTTDGQKEHWKCFECQTLFLDEQAGTEVKEEDLVISATSHTGGSADCTKKAVCTTCQKEYGELDKSKHSETEVKNKKDATCKEEGHTGDVYCKGCGEVISTGKTIEKAAHTWDNGVVTKETTETEKGIKTYTCSLCQETKTEDIPATGKVVTPEKPGEVVTPEKPGTVTPAPTATATPIPTEKPSKEEQKAPKKGTILTDKKGGGKYKVLTADKNKTVEYVKPLSKKSTKAYIPATVKINGITYKVVSIAKNAFKNHESITKVTIGKNVKTIGANAFYGCKKLKKVSMGKNVTSIGDKAFYKCTILTKITIPSKVKKIGKQTFYGCEKLKTITIKTTKLTQKNVGSKAFMGINKKATIKVPKSKVKAYQKLLKSKGVDKTVKVKK